MSSLLIAVTDAWGRPVAARGLGVWLAGAAPRRARGRVGVALVTDGMMRRLNRTYRNVDRATDVLSFPGGVATGRPKPLGDIAIAVGVAERQARAAGHSRATELRVLALHGLLHLLGYDHERDQGQMARAEERLRRRAGLPSGLIARAPQRRGRRAPRRRAARPRR